MLQFLDESWQIAQRSSRRAQCLGAQATNLKLAWIVQVVGFLGVRRIDVARNGTKRIACTLEVQRHRKQRVLAIESLEGSIDLVNRVGLRFVLSEKRQNAFGQGLLRSFELLARNRHWSRSG